MKEILCVGLLVSFSVMADASNHQIPSWTLFQDASNHQILPHGQSSSRAAETENECMYPNYYCSFTQDNVIDPSGLGLPINQQEDCYFKCKNTAGCNHYTWMRMRGVSKCYLLDKCDNGLDQGPNYRIYDDHCLARNPRKCVSGPKNCGPLAPNTPCPRPFIPPGWKYIDWQCEDSKEGNKISFYGSSDITAGTRCMQTCASWQSERRNQVTVPAAQGARAYIFSECLANGSWTNVLPYDRYDGASEMHWPALADLGSGNYLAYPKPDAQVADTDKPLECICQTIELKWPPSQQMADASGVSLNDWFYYNPRSEYGTDMQCYPEVLNAAVDAAGKFEIQHGTLCRLLCDTILVATVQCIDGKWKGGVEDLGMWCYDYPEKATAMNWQRTVWNG